MCLSSVLVLVLVVVHVHVVVLVLVLTQQLVGQHVELLLVQASLGDGGELPAQHLRQLGPLGGRRRQEELEVLLDRAGR